MEQGIRPEFEDIIAKPQRRRPRVVGLERDALELGVDRARVVLHNDLVAAGHALAARKNPSRGRFFRVRAGGWMVDKTEVWKVDGVEVEIQFVSGTKRNGQLSVSLGFYQYCRVFHDFADCGHPRPSTKAQSVMLDLVDGGDFDVKPLIEHMEAMREAWHQKVSVALSSEDRQACAQVREHNYGAARLVRAFLPEEAIQEREDVLTDGTWIRTLVTPGTGTTVAGDADGIVIKTAPMNEEQARQLLQLCKQLGVL